MSFAFRGKVNMPKKLKITIRENVKTGKRTIDMTVDDGFSGDDVLPESSLVAEAAVLWALHFPEMSENWSILKIGLPSRLSQDELAWQLSRLARKTLAFAVTARNFNINEKTLLEADGLVEAGVSKFEDIYG